jgi:hypothetical protein
MNISRLLISSVRAFFSKFFSSVLFTALFCRLFEQIQSVYNKIEFRDNALFVVIIGQIANAIKSQRCFSAALGMPNNAFGRSLS